ncbi:MAG TPA: class I SAM-dependent methyltransferase [Polyangiaceae bacterium]|jgi:SAM-dependent methyltransferase
MFDASFDEAYFERFYERRATRVYDAEQVAHLARGVVSMIRWLGGPVETVLDVGAGAGFWRDYLAKEEPDVRYTSIDASPYACERYGHEHRDITRWRAGEKFDLVVCQGVLPYIDDDGARRAIENLGAMTRGFLYLEAITARDVREVCDLDKTDVAVHVRGGAFYTRALASHFTRVGCGLWCAKRGPLRFYELEAAS